MFPKNCQRCRKELTISTMSRFNTDTICEECEEIEKKHPMYETARETEHQEVKNGNYNYKGIGLPSGYSEWAKEQKNHL